MTYKVRPTNGVSYGVKHTIVTEDMDVAAIAEIVSLTVTAGDAGTTAGNVTVTLPSLTGVTVALLTTDTTVNGVATKIRNATYTGWTTGGTNATVTFTKNVAGAVSGTPTFVDTATTGVTATITIATPGANAINNSIVFDFRVGGSSYRYPLSANVHTFNPTTHVDTTAASALTLDFSVDGVVTVGGGYTSGQILEVTAQRASPSV